MAFAVVNTVPAYLTVILLLIIQAYFVYTRFDSIEALFFSRFILRAREDQIGKQDIGHIRWAAHQLKRGAIMILIAGLTTFALSLVTPELLYVVESSVDVYVWAVYQASDFFAPVSPGLGVVVVTVSAAVIAILLVWASKMVSTFVRGVLRKRS